MKHTEKLRLLFGKKSACLDSEVLLRIQPIPGGDTHRIDPAEIHSLTAQEHDFPRHAGGIAERRTTRCDDDERRHTLILKPVKKIFHAAIEPRTIAADVAALGGAARFWIPRIRSAK